MLYLLIILLAVAGFFIAHHIRHKKAEAAFVCPMKARCDIVVQSKYSKIVGVPVEMLGMVYYGCLIAGYVIVALLQDAAVAGTLYVALLWISAFATLFSIYLTLVQSFAIKHFCTWCLGSAAISIAIFVIALLPYL